MLGQLKMSYKRANIYHKNINTNEIIAKRKEIS